MVKFKDKKNKSQPKDDISFHTKSGAIKKKKLDKVEKKKYLKKFKIEIKDKKEEADSAISLKDASKSVNGSWAIDKIENVQDAFSILWVKYKPRSTPHVKSGSDWTVELLPETEDNKVVPLITRKRLKSLAERMYRDDLQAHRNLQEKRVGHGSKPFHKLILNHGTTRDKIAELSFQCMESPVYSLNALSSLIDFIDPKFKNNCSEAIDNVLNIFQTTLLPNNYVAKEFECHNFSILVPLLKSNLEQVEKQLILWNFESQVQLNYIKFINNLEKLSHDSRISVKTWGVNGLNKLLKIHPNQEIELVLRKLVNKLGDSNKKVAGNVLHMLMLFQLSQLHQRATLVSFLEELLYRPNVSSRAQYYCLCCLKDIVFKKSDQSLAERLVKLYFDFFRICSESGEVDSRFMGALLRGLNRAYPHLEGKRLSFLEDQVSTLYRLCHMVNFGVGTQALQLIYQVQSSTDNEMSDRFYSLLYRKLLNPSFANSSATGAFLNILFKAMVRDTNLNRIRAFFKRLLQVCKYHSPHIVVSVLFLISEAIKDNPGMGSVAMLFNTTKKTWSKFGCKTENDDDDDDDYEYYPDLDVDDEDDGQQDIPTSSASHDSTGSKTKMSRWNNSSDVATSTENVKIKTESSWLHRENLRPFHSTHEVRTNHYDPLVRNPAFAGANLSPIWELRDLEHYFHPTVSLFASQLLEQTHIEYSGDPLQDFTLTRFLDRFIQRNPKKIDANKKTDQSANIFGSRSCYTPKGSRNIPVNSDKFKSLEKSAIPVEDIVFYNFYTQYQKMPGVKKEIEKEEEEYEDSDDEFDAYLSKMNRNLENIHDADDDAEDELDFAGNAIAVPSAENEEEASDMDESVDEDMDRSEDEIDENTDNEDDDGAIDDDTLDVEEDYEDDSFSEDADVEEELDDEEDSFEDDYLPHKTKLSKKPKFSSSSDWRSMLVDADEFSQLLESNAYDPLAGTSEALSNKDNAGDKQLKWEKKGRQKSFQPRSSTGGNSRKFTSKTNFNNKGNSSQKRKKKYSK